MFWYSPMMMTPTFSGVQVKNEMPSMPFLVNSTSSPAMTLGQSRYQRNAVTDFDDLAHVDLAGRGLEIQDLLSE